MAVFYLTLLYFFIFLSLERFDYFKINRLSEYLPTFIIILAILLLMLLGLINIVLIRTQNKFKFQFKLGYPQKNNDRLVINLGVVIISIVILVYLYIFTPTLPFWIATMLCCAASLPLYQSKKNFTGKMPLFVMLILSVFLGLFLAPAHPTYLILSVFLSTAIFLWLTNIINRNKKTPLYIGDKNFYHVFIVLLLFVLAI